jgi:hypothetical protein
MQRRTFLSASLAGAGAIITAPARASLGFNSPTRADRTETLTCLRDARGELWNGEDDFYSPVVFGVGHWGSHLVRELNAVAAIRPGSAIVMPFSIYAAPLDEGDAAQSVPIPGEPFAERQWTIVAFAAAEPAAWAAAAHWAQCVTANPNPGAGPPMRIAIIGVDALDDLRHAEMAARLKALRETMDLLVIQPETAGERACNPMAFRPAIQSLRWFLMETTLVAWYDLDDLRKTLAFGPLAVATSRRCAGSDQGGDLTGAVDACLDALGAGTASRACLRWSNGMPQSFQDLFAIAQHAEERCAAATDPASSIAVTLGIDPDIRPDIPGRLHGLLWPRDPASLGLPDLRG